MSKERLKYWEELWGIGYVKFVPDLFEYAKEQAERVAELETDSSAFHTLENLFIESEQQNKRYREALINLRDHIEKRWKQGCALEATLYIDQALEESE